MTRGKAREPWSMRLPAGLRDQPAWVFIGLLVALSGLTFLFGVTESSIVNAVGPLALRVWGLFLFLSGTGVVTATLSARPALEKLALRMLSICIFVYIGWLLTVVDWRRAVMSVVLGGALIGLAEIRIAVLKALFRASEEWRHHGDNE